MSEFDRAMVKEWNAAYGDALARDLGQNLSREHRAIKHAPKAQRPDQRWSTMTQGLAEELWAAVVALLA